MSAPIILLRGREGAWSGGMIFRFLIWLIAGAALTGPGRAESFLQRSWLSEDGLPGNFVRSVVQTRDRFLWVATAEGVVRFDGVRFSPPGGELPAEFSQLRTKSLFPQEDGSVWIAVEAGGLLRWKDREWTVIWPVNYTAGVNLDVTQVVEAGDGSVNAVRGGSVWQIPPTGTPAKLDPVPAAVQKKLEEDQESWKTSGRFIPGGPAPALVDREGRRWITGNDGGLTLQKTATKSTSILPAGSGITSLTEDHEGNIWVALESGGLLSLRERRVHMLREEQGPGGAATCLLQDRSGVFWIGDRRGGIDSVEKGKRTSLKLQDGTVQRAVTLLFEDSSGRLWAGTRDGSLFVRTDGDFVQHQHGAPLAKVNGMAEDAAGRLWVIGAYGLALVQVEAVTLVAGPEAFRGRPSSILITRDQEVWIGTSEGEIRHGPTEAGALPTVNKTGSSLADGQRISALYYDSAGLLWVATHGAGLLKYEARSGWTPFDATRGLPDSRLTAITEDASRNLWLGSLGGILRLKRSHVDSTEELLPWMRLDRSDGLSTRECTGYNQPSVCRSREETLWFPTSGGVAVIRQESLRPVPAPDPVIEQAAAGAKVLYPGPDRSRLIAGPGRQRLDFRFTVPSFSAPEKIRFRTRLTGLDDAWRESGPLRTAAYDAVPPGTYQFEVTAIDGDGTFSRIASLAVEVLPRWWETLPFRIAIALLAAAAAGGAGWLVARQRAKARISRLQLRHAQEAERARIARDLHDDLGASLTEISLLAGLSAEDAPAGPHRQSLEEIATRAQHVVGTLDEIVWAVDPRHDTVASLVEYLSSWGQEFLSRAGITLRLDIPREVTAVPMEAERRHALFLAVREALHNIMKHSGAKEAWLRMRHTQQQLTVVVEDTGAGFDPSQSTKGNGLENYQERMATCGGRVSLTTAPGEGTRLEFRLPLPAATS